MNEIVKIQTYLEQHKYQIKIFSKDAFNDIIYQGIDFIVNFLYKVVYSVGPAAEKVLHLYLHDNHFDVITRPKAFMGRSYFCESCNKGYNTKEDHRCNKDGCHGCHSEKACAFENWAFCKDCNRYLPSQSCFDKHKFEPPSTSNAKRAKLMSVCDKWKRCKTCNEMLDSGHRKRHQCGKFMCKTCDMMVGHPHSCYIQVFSVLL